ncbi:hypothetical protein D3A96_09810 [Robertkochia marina]|nr:hypothetical protein D3A96_09810 [Robertkochia marina]
MSKACFSETEGHKKPGLAEQAPVLVVSFHPRSAEQSEALQRITNEKFQYTNSKRAKKQRSEEAKRIYLFQPDNGHKKPGLAEQAPVLGVSFHPRSAEQSEALQRITNEKFQYTNSKRAKKQRSEEAKRIYLFQPDNGHKKPGLAEQAPVLVLPARRLAPSLKRSTGPFLNVRSSTGSNDRVERGS